MRTNIEIDDRLMAEVLKLTGLRTKRQAVETALRLLLQTRLRDEIFELASPELFFEGYDPEEGDEARFDEWGTALDEPPAPR